MRSFHDLAAAMLVATMAGVAGGTLSAELSASEELVFLLQYIGTDYGAAVRDGKVIDPREYSEILGFSEALCARYRALPLHGQTGPELERLRELIRRREPWDAVRAATRELIPRLANELEVVTYPAQTPDLERGRGLYALDCAPCHGVAGGGDGRAAPGMAPAPSSFREGRMNLISPHQVYNAAQFGVAGTAMPSYRGARSPQELWDMAFYVMTLREGFDPRLPVIEPPLSIAELASRSNEELLNRLHASRPDAGIFEIDSYRAALPRSAGPAGLELDVEDSALQVAEQLERAFARAAEKVFPGVVGVSLYEKVASPAKLAEALSRPEGWQVGDAEERMYPGFRRVKSASGFVVSDDGYVLTSFDLFKDRDADRTAEVIDIELPGNIHCRARVIGLEPTIDLAVLEAYAQVPVQPVRLGDSDRVQIGQWAIAVGDPPGVEKSFATGTIAARPERDCYQEHRKATLIQSSAVLEPAGFGGPLVNIRGEVIGLTIPGSDVRPAAGDSLVGPVDALPINLAMTVYKALREKESERSPWLGISVLHLSPRVRSELKSPPLTGIYIDDVFVPSPASKADIRVGDVLTAMSGNRILGVSDFQRWLYILGIDTTVTLELDRAGQTIRKDVKIEQRPATATMR